MATREGSSSKEYNRYMSYAKKKAYWKEAFVRQQESGQTILQFCRVNKLSKSVFYTWRRRIMPASEEKGGNPFVPMHIPKPMAILPTPQPREDIEIAMPSGAIMRNLGESNISLAAKLLITMEKLNAKPTSISQDIFVQAVSRHAV